MSHKWSFTSLAWAPKTISSSHLSSQLAICWIGPLRRGPTWHTVPLPTMLGASLRSTEVPLTPKCESASLAGLPTAPHPLTLSLGTSLSFIIGHIRIIICLMTCNPAGAAVWRSAERSANWDKSSVGRRLPSYHFNSSALFTVSIYITSSESSLGHYGNGAIPSWVI